MNVVMMNAGQILFKGGPMMWPILFLSILATAIAINRIMFLSREEKTFTQQHKLLLESLRKGNLKDTLKMCEANEGVVASLIKSGIIRSGSSTELIRLAMDEVWDHQKMRFNSFMSILGMIVNVAPLLGLLGTVNAMTVVFHASVIRSNVLNPVTAGELATGIWQALLTTTAGLVVGIFGYVMYTFCVARINVYTTWVNHLMVETVYVLASLKELKASAGQGEYEG